MKKLIDSNFRYGIAIIFLIAIISFSNSCTKDTLGNTTGTNGNPDAKPGNNEVWMQSSLFTPETITVSAGTTVIWTNKEISVHTVTSDTGLFDSSNIAKNETFSFKFNTAGTFLYHCKLHTAMTGKVVVN